MWLWWVVNGWFTVGFVWVFRWLGCDDGGLWVTVFFDDGGLKGVGLLVRIGYDMFAEC